MRKSVSGCKEKKKLQSEFSMAEKEEREGKRVFVKGREGS